MTLMRPDCIYNRLEVILYPLGLYLVETELDNVLEPGIGTWEIVVTKSIPSIDYHQYYFTLTLNYGDNKSRDEHYDLSLDKAIRQVVQVDEILPKDKGVIVLNCELIV